MAISVLPDDYEILSENVLKPISNLLSIAPSDLSSAFDSFYWMIMALNQILLPTYLLTYLPWKRAIFSAEKCLYSVQKHVGPTGIWTADAK